MVVILVHLSTGEPQWDYSCNFILFSFSSWSSVETAVDILLSHQISIRKRTKILRWITILTMFWCYSIVANISFIRFVAVNILHLFFFSMNCATKSFIIFIWSFVLKERKESGYAIIWMLWNNPIIFQCRENSYLYMLSSDLQQSLWVDLN